MLEKEELRWKGMPKKKFKTKIDMNDETKEKKEASQVWWSMEQFIPHAQPWQKHTSENETSDPQPATLLSEVLEWV